MENSSIGQIARGNPIGFLCDPSNNLILFAESIPEEETSTEQGI
jgi:hypothetical protein